MARKRIPSPEQQTSDRQMVAGLSQILHPLSLRYPAKLDAAFTLLREFANSKVEQPAKRKASMKTRSLACTFCGNPKEPGAPCATCTAPSVTAQ